MKSSDLFIKQLEEEKVEYIFGLPGEENLDLLDSIRKSNIKLIVTRHEQAAAFMAATYGRLTGKAGVCLSTLGPGATNLVTGIAHAQLIGAPLVSISGQKAIKNNWQARFQLVDIVSLMKPITKKSISIIDPGTIPTVLRDAFKLAESERPGAVHIELPEDVAEENTNATIQKKTNLRRSSPEKIALQKTSDLIKKAKNPLIIISSGANRKRVSKELMNFINKTGIFVVHTQMGKGVISDDCPCSLYAVGIHKRDYVNCGIDRADLIITIGYNIVEYPPYIWNKDLNKKIINIDFTPFEPDKYFNPNIEIIGDIAESLKQLTKLIKKKKKYPVFQKTRKLIDSKLNMPLKKTYPPEPAQIIHEVQKVMSKNDILTFDNGIYKIWFSRLFKTYNPNTFLVDNAFATMGAGVPSGIVAKLLNPNKKVISIVGDGGFMMNSQEIETAIRNKIPLVILLINDNAFGFIKWKQKSMKLPSYALDYKNPDFVKYAESYGAIGMKLKPNDKLSDILKHAFSLNQVVLIEVPVDYSKNYSVFSEELGNLICKL